MADRSTVVTQIVATKTSDQEEQHRSTVVTQTVTKTSDQHRQPDNPILGFFSNFLKLFNLPIPFLPPPPAAKTKQPEEPTNKANPVVVGDFAAETTKPPVVKFPRPTEETLPSIKLEAADEVEERNTNPVVLWQVYAIGGFFVLRWAWTRWNERRERKKPSDENPPPADE